MEKIGRQQRSESAWRELVDRQEQSGLSVAQFCEREGGKSASLYGWRSRLREGTKDTEVAPKKAKRREAPSSGFIDWAHWARVARALRFVWSWVTESCCTWSATDVLSGRSDPGALVWSALRYEEVV